MTETERTLQIVQSALADLKAIDVDIIPVANITTITDVMVIVSGRSNRHVKAIADEVLKQAKQAGITIIGYEGEQEGEWILVDLADVIVHVMLPRMRDFYRLDKLWRMQDDPEQVKGSY